MKLTIQMIFKLILIILAIVLLYKCYGNIIPTIEQICMYNKNIYSNSDLYITKSIYGGYNARGVFSNKNFNKGDIVEIAPFIEEKKEHIFKDKEYAICFDDYIFKRRRNGNGAIMLGFVSIYNHSDNPNVFIKTIHNYGIVTALRDIKKDEEILISYGENYWKGRIKIS